MKHIYRSIKNLTLTVGLSVFLISFSLLQACSSPQASSSDEKASSEQTSLDAALESASAILNKMCPMMVDTETRLDNSKVLPGKIFQYNYTLVNYIKDSLDVEALKTAIMPNIVNVVKTNPDLKFQRDNEVTMDYYYNDKNGVFLFKLSITPNLYK